MKGVSVYFTVSVRRAQDGMGLTCHSVSPHSSHQHKKIFHSDSVLAVRFYFCPRGLHHATKPVIVFGSRADA